MTNPIKIAVVSPIYYAENTVEELVQRVLASLKTIPCEAEVILVDDGSKDDSWSKITSICETNPEVTAIKLSRNFGQHNAITAGLQQTVSDADWVVVMDCDLQDVPEEIPKLYQKALEGYDMVLARRKERKDKASKRWSSKFFYRMFSYFTDTKQDSAIANFGIYNRKVIEAVLSMKDKIRVFPILVQWIGFEKTTLDVDHAQRKEGKSTYTLKKLFKLAFDLFVSFSNKPLLLTIRLGAIISILSFCVGLFYLIRYFNGKIEVDGFTSLIISIWLLSGIIIFSIGVLGLYIGKIFDATKDRPLFIIQEKISKS